MKKSLIFVLLVGILMALVGTSFAAKPEFASVQVVNPVTKDVKNGISVPEKAIAMAPGLFYLGQSQDNGDTVEGYAIIRYKEGFGKPSAQCGNGVCEVGENAKKCPADCGGSSDPSDSDVNSCYGFLGKGANWKSLEQYMVDPTNTRELDETIVRDILATAIDEWEMAADFNIFGDETMGIVDGPDFVSPDGQNEVSFADVEYDGAIAITVVWGVFRGAPSQRRLVEWDQVYDDVDFDWSTSIDGEENKMDLWNIVAHELGHSAGLGDLYTTKCSDQTMYGYAGTGETNKRSLDAGDIAGIQELY